MAKSKYAIRYALILSTDNTDRLIHTHDFRVLDSFANDISRNYNHFNYKIKRKKYHKYH